VPYSLFPATKNKKTQKSLSSWYVANCC